MSGPRARMGQLRLILLKKSDMGSLCPDCDPSAGWGWELSERQKVIDKKYSDPNGLPPPGNGFEVQGPCRTCDGTGLRYQPNYAQMALERCDEQDHHEGMIADFPCADCINYIVELERAVMACDCSQALRKTIDAFLKEQQKLFR